MSYIFPAILSWVSISRSRMSLETAELRLLLNRSKPVEPKFLRTAFLWAVSKANDWPSPWVALICWVVAAYVFPWDIRRDWIFLFFVRYLRSAVWYWPRSAERSLYAESPLAWADFVFLAALWLLPAIPWTIAICYLNYTLCCAYRSYYTYCIFANYLESSLSLFFIFNEIKTAIFK